MMTWILPTRPPGATKAARAGLPAVLTLAALVVVGCSSEPPAVVLPTAPLHPVKGSVLMADGKPLTEGAVTFAPVKVEARPAHGTIGPDGSFTLKTGDQDGAAEGDYIVSFQSAQTLPGPKAGSTKSAVPREFTEDGSTLQVSVKAGANEIPPIKLVSGKAGVARGAARN